MSRVKRPTTSYATGMQSQGAGLAQHGTEAAETAKTGACVACDNRLTNLKETPCPGPGAEKPGSQLGRRCDSDASQAPRGRTPGPPAPATTQAQVRPGPGLTRPGPAGG